MLATAAVALSLLAPAGEPAPAAVYLWGMDRPGRAARRLRARADVERATVVARGTLLLRAGRDAEGRRVDRVRRGHAIPLDALAIRPAAYAAAVPAVAGVRSGRAILTQTSAAVRRLGAGGTLRLTGGRRLRVVGVVPDEAVTSSEVVVSRRDPRLRDVRSEGVAVVLRAPVALDELRRAAGTRGAVVIGAPDDERTPSRPVKVKAAFGEPAVRLPYGPRWVTLDRGFVTRHVVTRRVPVLGRVTCHRAMIAPLRAALGELVRNGLARVVNPGDFAGCYAPRRIAGVGKLSLHAWGLAVDLNARANPFLGRSRQDMRLVRAMERHGFTWGGRWPVRRDPMHFELRAPPPG
jgi:hypothetical protein